MKEERREFHLKQYGYILTVIQLTQTELNKYKQRRLPHFMGYAGCVLHAVSKMKRTKFNHDE